MRPIRFTPIIVVMALLTGACSDPTGAASDRPVPDAMPHVPTTTPTSTATTSPASTTTTTPTTTTTTTTTIPATTTTTTIPTASDVFAQVSGSVGFVETPAGSGSAVLISDRLAVTNAHVVWPYGTVRVQFPGGIEIDAARVITADLMADGALLDLGPTASLPEPITPIARRDLPSGSSLYLIGYPDESDDSPEPTMSTGILSRVRRWDAVGVTYFQTDATIDPGQSGGALVDEQGQLVGISGFSFGDFALAVSAVDLLDRLQQPEGEPATAGTGRGFPPTSGGDREVATTLDGLLDHAQWTFEATGGQSVTIEVETRDDVIAAVLDPTGWILDLTNNVVNGTEELQFVPVIDGPHWLVVAPITDLEPGSEVLVRSTAPLRELDDPDHRSATVATPVVGRLDFGIDTDSYDVTVTPGAVYRIRVESMAIDAFASVFAADEWLGEDDDSGGGIFGLDAEVEVIATSAEVTVEVRSAVFGEVGDYILTIDEVGTDIDALEIGACFDEDPDAKNVWVRDVDCDEPHQSEVYALLEYPADAGEEFPDVEVLTDFGDRICFTELAAYLEEDPARTTIDFWFLYPTRDGWGEGDRSIICALTRPGADLVGSMRPRASGPDDAGDQDRRD